MKRALLVLFAGGLVWGACLFVGTSAGGFKPARSPYGVEAEIRIDGRRAPRFSGELLEVRDSTLLVLRDARVTEVPISAIRAARFPQNIVIDRGRISDGDREKLRLLSRYPGGLPAESVGQLLAAYGQTAPDSVVQP